METEPKATEWGFTYGAAEIRCITSDAKAGWVIFDILTPKTKIQVYVTKTGKIKMVDQQHNKEYTINKPNKNQTKPHKDMLKLTKRLDNAKLKGDWDEVDDISTELFDYWYKEKEIK